MQELLGWLKNHGLNFDPNLDNKIHRFSMDDDDGDAGWYVGSTALVPSGKTVITLTVSSWKWDKKLYFRSGGFSEGDLSAYKEILSKKKKEQDETTEAIQKEAKERAQKIWDISAEASETNPYLTRKGVGAFGVRENSQNLIVPVFGGDGEIQSLQRIFPDGQKIFLKGGKIQGGYFKIEGLTERVLICEGYATGASLFMATGYTVFIAFNAGNLLSVAKFVRYAWGDEKEIIICGDDDHGNKTNTGRERAEEAARSIGATTRFPQFTRPRDVAAEQAYSPGTDFNDLHCREGLDVVKKQVTGETKQKIEDTPKTTFQKRQDANESLFDESPIKFLGFSEGKHHYISRYSRKIVSLAPAAHTQLQLLELMGLGYWDAKYSQEIIKKDKVIKTPIQWASAADDLMSQSLTSGFFDSGRIRGSGFYRESKKLILNIGNALIVDGKTMQHNEFNSNYIYIHGPKISVGGAANNDECQKLISIGKKLLWQKKEDAYFFLGWLSCAVLSGALEWRPHLYITGGAGVGKSWILENVVHPLIKDISEYFLSNSSEAGIRQSIKNNAMAIIWDEPEVNNEQDNKNIQRVLALARQSSFESGGRVSRGTASGSAMEFSVKSCFLLGSIKDAIQEGADNTRFTILGLTKLSGAEESLKHFKELERMVFDLIDSGFSSRFIARMYEKFDLFEKTNKELKSVISREYNSRVAQQYAALLAGYHVIASDKEISWSETESYLGLLKNQDNLMLDPAEDVLECYHYLTAKILVIDSAEGSAKGGSVRMSVGEIFDRQPLWDRLESYGMKIVLKDDKKYLFVCYKHPQLKEIFRDSKWISGWGRSFSKIPGTRPSTQRISSLVRKGVEMPI